MFVLRLEGQRKTTTTITGYKFGGKITNVVDLDNRLFFFYLEPDPMFV